MIDTIQAYFTIAVNIRMEYLCAELQERRFIRIVISELNLETESPSLPNSVFRAINQGLPFIDIILVRHSVYSLLVTLLDLFEVLKQAPLSTRRHLYFINPPLDVQQMLSLQQIDQIDLSQLSIAPNSHLTLTLSPSGKYLAVIPAKHKGTIINLEDNSQYVLDFEEAPIGAMFALNERQLVITTQTNTLHCSLNGSILSQVTLSQSTATDITDTQPNSDYQSLYYANQSQLYRLEMQNKHISKINLPSNNTCSPFIFQFDSLTHSLVTSSYDCHLCLYQKRADSWNITREVQVDSCRASKLTFFKNQIVLTQSTVSSVEPQVVLLSADKLELVGKASYVSRSAQILVVPMRNQVVSFGKDDFSLWLSQNNLSGKPIQMNLFPQLVKQAVFSPLSGHIYVGLLDAGSLQLSISKRQIVYNCDLLLSNNTQTVEYSERCSCQEAGYKFRAQTLQCQKMFCQLNEANNCNCNNEQSFEEYSLTCRLDCNKVIKSFLSPPFGSPLECSCQSPFQWNSRLSDCSYINCAQLAHTVAGTLGTTCTCISGYTWQASALECLQNETSVAGGDSSGIGPIAIFAIVLGVILLGVLGVMMYVKKCRNPPEDEPKPFQVKKEPEDGYTSRPLGQGDIGSTKAFKEDLSPRRNKRSRSKKLPPE